MTADKRACSQLSTLNLVVLTL